MNSYFDICSAHVYCNLNIVTQNFQSLELVSRYDTQLQVTENVNIVSATLRLDVYYFEIILRILYGI